MSRAAIVAIWMLCQVAHVVASVWMLIAALYGNHARGVIETQVRFEDGRSGWLRADLAIEAARTVAMEVAA